VVVRIRKIEQLAPLVEIVETWVMVVGRGMLMIMMIMNPGQYSIVMPIRVLKPSSN